MPTTDARWFRAKLANVKMTQRGFAKKIGVDPAAVTRMFDGERRMQISEAIAFARAVRVRLEDVLKHAGLDP